MAKITYENKVALNQNSSIPDINKVNDTDMNMIKNVVNNNETKVLLAVSSSAPATCDTGDIYFNTTDNLIYTATATDTWGATGVAPTENTIYIEFTSQTAYAYDGTTLISVGGGASGGGETLPIGTVLEFPTTDSTKVPDGWLFCDGSAVSRTTYADLFAIIGTSYGAGDGSTTFNLPTKEGLVSVGIKSSDTDFNTIGKTGGSKTHKHLMPFILDNNVNNFNKMQWNTSSGYGNEQATANNSNQLSVSPTTESFTGYKPYSEPVSSLQPYTVTNYIIKATQTTPVQAEVVNTYSESTENAYSCDYINGKVLYENASGSNGSITLSENYSNYEYLLISYKKSDNNYYETALIPTAYNKFRLDYIHEGNTLLSNGYSMSGQTITRDDGYYFKITTNEYYTGSWIYIYKVVGHN